MLTHMVYVTSIHRPMVMHFSPLAFQSTGNTKVEACPFRSPGARAQQSSVSVLRNWAFHSSRKRISYYVILRSKERQFPNLRVSSATMLNYGIITMMRATTVPLVVWM